MISKFKNQFKKNDFYEQKFFQNRIFNLLEINFPDFRFVKADDPLIIYWNENKLGLSNIYAQFLLTAQTNYELTELVKDHFEKVIESKDLLEDKEQLWEEINNLVLPQLMPVEYSSQFQAVNFPFGEEIHIGFVVDDEKAYQYVTQEALNEWGISDSELWSAGIENLSEKSYDLEMTFVPPPNGIIVINTMDSFDAVRILVPHIQEFIREKLGETFYFGVPNRDFLICWSKHGDKNFQKSIIKQIAADFDERPYPLSKFFFELDKNGEFKQMREFKNLSRLNLVNNN